MTPELWEILIGVGGLVLGWLARHKGIGPGPSPTPNPTPSPLPIFAILELIWNLLRTKFPSLPPLAPNTQPTAEHFAALSKAMAEAK